MENNKAFTLIELIVVMAIIAVLVLLAAPRFLGYTKDANVTAMEQDIKVLSDASEMYHLDNNEWPTIDEAAPTYIGYGGVGEIYPVDESKLESSIKNIRGDYSDYGIAVDGKYRGQVFHLNGVESKDDELVFGGNIKLPDYSARPQPQTQRGVNLMENGDGSYGDNTNFKRLIYTNQVTFEGKPSFHNNGNYLWMNGYDKTIPVDPNLTYKMSYNIKASQGNVNRSFAGIVSYDIDKKEINASHHMYIKDSLTALAKDLVPGDTVVYLKDSTNWINNAGTASHRRKLILWGYTDSTGYTYPAETYSRYVSPYDTWSDGAINYQTNSITLNEPWDGEEHKAGTMVSNGSSGNIHKYIAGNFLTPDEWTFKEGKVTGIDYSGQNITNKFPPGTQYMRPGWIFNHLGENTGVITYISDAQLEIVD